MTWTSQSADGFSSPPGAPRPHMVELRVSHKDAHFKPGLFFIGARCVDDDLPGLPSGCPMESNWTITHETQTPTRLFNATGTLQANPNSGPNPNPNPNPGHSPNPNPNATGTLQGTQIDWWEMCIDDFVPGLQIETQV